MARAGVWGHEQNYTAKIRKPPTPQPELFSLEEEPGGGLPAPLSEVAGRQEKVVRHVLEDLGSVCPFVQILDLPVPHRMDHLAELLNLEEDVLDAGRLVDRFFQVPELVIEVPKISLDVIPLRALVPEPQLAEQLVEVPTIVSFSSLQRIMEQTVDIPVPQGGGGRVGVRSLQGFPGQSSSAYCGADFPAATAEQNVDIPVPRGDRTLLPASSSSVLPVTANQGVFRTFPQNKKSAELGSHSGSELLPESSPSTLAAQLKEEMEVLFAVPLELRTPAQRARLRELVIASSQARRRKRKKRRKKRTPRTSSLPGRARRRQRQWSACYAGFTGYNTPRVMFPSVDARPKMLCIMAGMHQEDSYVVFAGDDAPRAVPSRFHRCSSWTIYWPVLCNDRFSGPGAVLGLVLTCPLLCLTGEVGPDSSENRGIAAVAVLRRWLTSLLHAATSSCSSRAENSRYAQCKLCTFRGDPPGAVLGQVCYARCVQRQALVFQTVQKTCGGPGPDFLDKEVDMPAVVPHWCPGPASQKTVEVPLLHFFDKD